MATEEPLSLTEEEQCEINASLCLIYSKLNGRLKSITVQNQRGFINYGRQREKITVNLIESDCIMVNKDKFDERAKAAFEDLDAYKRRNEVTEKQVTQVIKFSINNFYNYRITNTKAL